MFWDGHLETLAWLTATGAINRAETSDYLEGLFASLRPQGESYVWVGWEKAVAALGLDHLAPLVEQVFERGWIDEMFTEVEEFREDLRHALRPDAAVGDLFGRAFIEIDRHDDVAGMMATWPYFKPELPRARPRTEVAYYGRTLIPAEPVCNPLRHVGRNDPCPCGSGKKFKKCCLGNAA